MLPVNGLSETLIPTPIRARLMDADTDRILILPVADLGAVPWAALPLDRKMLVDKAAPVVLADIDWILQQPPPFEASRGGLIIGDPDLSEDKKWRFTPLPAAREEAEIVAQHLSASLLLGAEANHRSVMAELSQPWGGLIYFATHGLADPVNPMDGSFLALKDEHLYARDIKKLVLLQRPLTGC
jgi:CHAT domain-containing protein